MWPWHATPPVFISALDSACNNHVMDLSDNALIHLHAPYVLRWLMFLAIWCLFSFLIVEFAQRKWTASVTNLTRVTLATHTLRACMLLRSYAYVQSARSVLRGSRMTATPVTIVTIATRRDFRHTYTEVAFVTLGRVAAKQRSGSCFLVLNDGSSWEISTHGSSSSELLGLVFIHRSKLTCIQCNEQKFRVTHNSSGEAFSHHSKFKLSPCWIILSSPFLMHHVVFFDMLNS